MLNLWIIDGEMIDEKIKEFEAEAHFAKDKDKAEFILRLEELNFVKQLAIKIKQ